MTEEPKPTPRTDAQCSNQTLPQAMGYVPADFARQLETELADKDVRLTALLERWEELRNKTVDDMVALGCHPEANHIGGRLIYLDQCIAELRSTLNP